MMRITIAAMPIQVSITSLPSFYFDVMILLAVCTLIAVLSIYYINM